MSRDSLVTAAAKAVELHYLKSAEAEVKAARDAVAIARATIEKLEQELVTCQEEIESLETVEGDPTPSARILTVEVARLLGRDELKFTAANGKYQVTRDGRPAVGLSVGERTAITLVHFFEVVARFATAKR
jgi:wobble nucleotide-excising tRNase